MRFFVWLLSTVGVFAGANAVAKKRDAMEAEAEAQELLPDDAHRWIHCVVRITERDVVMAWPGCPSRPVSCHRVDAALPA